MASVTTAQPLLNNQRIDTREKIRYIRNYLV